MVPLAIVTTNYRKSADGIVVMIAGETQKEQRPEQLTVGVNNRLWNGTLSISREGGNTVCVPKRKGWRNNACRDKHLWKRFWQRIT